MLEMEGHHQLAKTKLKFIVFHPLKRLYTSKKCFDAIVVVILDVFEFENTLFLHRIFHYEKFTRVFPLCHNRTKKWPKLGGGQRNSPIHQNETLNLKH